MRAVLKTPSGVLGLISLTLLIVLTTFSALFFTGINTSTRKTECIARELAKPWASLRTSFNNPPGDLAARATSARIISKALVRIDHIDNYC